MTTPTPHPDFDDDDKVVAADVYAGDTTALTSSADTRTNIFLFRIQADAEPDAFARVAGIFNIANTAPRRVALRRTAPDQLNMSVAIELPLDSTADMIRRKLTQLTCTISADYVVIDSVAKALL
jgi:hypothetical protein